MFGLEIQDGLCFAWGYMHFVCVMQGNNNIRALIHITFIIIKIKTQTRGAYSECDIAQPLRMCPNMMSYQNKSTTYKAP